MGRIHPKACWAPPNLRISEHTLSHRNDRPPLCYNRAIHILLRSPTSSFLCTRRSGARCSFPIFVRSCPSLKKLAIGTTSSSVSEVELCKTRFQGSPIAEQVSSYETNPPARDRVSLSDGFVNPIPGFPVHYNNLHMGPPRGWDIWR